MLRAHLQLIVVLLKLVVVLLKLRLVLLLLLLVCGGVGGTRLRRSRCWCTRSCESLEQTAQE